MVESSTATPTYIPTSTVTQVTNGTTVVYLSPCATTGKGQCVTTVTSTGSGGSGPSSRGLLGWILFTLLFMLGHTLADQVDDTSEMISIRGNSTDALNYAWDVHQAGEDISNVTFYALESEILIENITFESNVTLAKRWDGSSAPLGASWTQRQVARQGRWLAPWYAASCVLQNERSTQATSTQVCGSMSYSMSASAGFDFNFGKSAAFSLGVTITKTNTQSTCNTYTVPPGSDGQIWQQQLMVWQEQQTQKCHKYHYGANGIHCGAWSAYIHADIPVQNGVSFGWSTGHNNMDFAHCRQ